MGEMLKDLSIHLVVTGVVRTRLRLWLGLRIIRLATWVIGCGIDIQFKGKDDIGVTADGLPRALSIYEHHRGYQPDALLIGADLVIKLDGVERSDVVAYDIDAGRVVQFVRSADGSMNSATLNGPPHMYHFKGVVTVERAHGRPARV